MTATTIAEFKNDVYASDIALPDLPSDESFYVLFSRAISNVRAELRGFEPSRFETWLEDQTSPVAFPSDLVEGEPTMFYPHNEYEFPFASSEVIERNSTWIVQNYTNFNIKYSKDIARVTSMSDAFPFRSEKCEAILIPEMIALIYGAYEQNEATPSVTNSLTQSNRVR